MVTTHSEEQWQLLKSLRNQGRSYDARWFNHVRLGFNYRIGDVQAALGIAQLEGSTGSWRCARRAADRYGELLAGIDGVEVPLADDADHARSWFVYVVKLARGVDRDARHRRTSAREGVRPAHYVPCVHLQPYLRERYGFREGTVPGRRGRARRTLALPFFTGITAQDQSVRRRRAARQTTLADNAVADGAPKMVFLGFGKYARADKIYALEPLARRRAWRRPPHARLGRGRRRADRRVAHRAEHPLGDGRERRPRQRAARRGARARRADRRRRRPRPRRPARPLEARAAPARVDSRRARPALLT